MSTLRQASCVAVAGRAILVEGAPGSGKSSLALALIDRGAVLVGDDGVSLEVREGHLWASPPPNIAGLVEVRNVGLVRFPATSAPVALVLRLGGDPPRLPDSAGTENILGCAIPLLAFHPGDTASALRAELALSAHGLPLPPASAQDRPR